MPSRPSTAITPPVDTAIPRSSTWSPNRVSSSSQPNRLLTAGSDDYVTKPFSLEEVVARLRALMRRSGASDRRTASVLTVGDLRLDEDSHEVFRGDDEIRLTATEFELLR